MLPSPARTLRVAYVLQTGVPDMHTVSGPQLHITAVVKALKRRGHQVRVLMPRSGRISWSDDPELGAWHDAKFGFSAQQPFRLVERPIRRIQSELHLPYLNLFESMRYSDAARGVLTGFDVIFERFGFMGFGGALTAARLGMPLILEVNGDIPKEMELLKVGMTRAQRRISATITRRTLRAASRIVCVAAGLKRKLVENMGVDGNKIEVIPNGADVDLFIQPYDPVAIRTEFQLPLRPTVTFVGSFQPWHGVDLLLDAFCRVSRESSAQLLLVGDGQGRTSAEARCAQLGMDDRVRFMGLMSNSNVAKILAVTDVAVVPFPNLGDEIVGSPLKIFEYMAAGCAIVASWGSIHDTVEHQITGIRVPPGNADALSDAVLTLLKDSDLRRRLGTRAREIAINRYSWTHTVEHLERVLASTLVGSA